MNCFLPSLNNGLSNSLHLIEYICGGVIVFIGLTKPLLIISYASCDCKSIPKCLFINLNFLIKKKLQLKILKHNFEK